VWFQDFKLLKNIKLFNHEFADINNTHAEDAVAPMSEQRLRLALRCMSSLDDDRIEGYCYTRRELTRMYPRRCLYIARARQIRGTCQVLAPPYISQQVLHRTPRACSLVCLHR
jgi:hypothetical protein